MNVFEPARSRKIESAHAADNIDYVDDRETTATFELDFHFEYNNKVHAPFPIIGAYGGPIPRREEIVLFSGAEGKALLAAGLPPDVWQVRKVAFDFADTSTKRISITLVNMMSVYQCGKFRVH